MFDKPYPSVDDTVPVPAKNWNVYVTLKIPMSNCIESQVLDLLGDVLRFTRLSISVDTEIEEAEAWVVGGEKLKIDVAEIPIKGD